MFIKGESIVTVSLQEQINNKLILFLLMNEEIILWVSIVLFVYECNNAPVNVNPEGGGGADGVYCGGGRWCVLLSRLLSCQNLLC